MIEVKISKAWAPTIPFVAQAVIYEPGLTRTYGGGGKTRVAALTELAKSLAEGVQTKGGGTHIIERTA